MRIAIVGRSEALYNTALRLNQEGHDITSILTSKAAPEYLKNELDFKELANSLQIPFMCTTKIEKQRNFLLLGKPDVAISINYSAIIPPEITNLFKYGIFNAHGGDLPKYRGNACQAWAMLNGEKKIGLCIHKMVGGELDNGNIFLKKFLPISVDTQINTVISWINSEIPGMMSNVVRTITENPGFQGQPQSTDSKDILRCYPRRPEDGEINWDSKTIDIARLINASGPPYSGAFSFLNGQKITIHTCRILRDEENFLAVPGQILDILENEVCVATADGKLLISDIKIDETDVQVSKIFRSIRQRFS